ncbi:MAG TPA: hypothetical protein VM662_08815, partial [Sphingomonas sp.]|nr:hypothetical protein [Sphingomonas sp.]
MRSMPNAWRIFPTLGKAQSSAECLMNAENRRNQPFFGIGTHPAETEASPAIGQVTTPRFRETQTMTYQFANVRNAFVAVTFALLASAVFM